MHEQTILQKDVSSSYLKKYKFLRYIIVVKLPQTNYSLICIQEREERIARSRDVDSDDGVDCNEPERKNPFTSEEFFVYYNVNNCTTFTNVKK